jgi:catechol 2,3-dioxygenase-like lactoylglutathione lyase family enzyme
MALVDAKGLVHFSLPANDVEESLRFYTEVLGMRFRGNVGANGRCVVAGDVNIILVGRDQPRPPGELLEHNGSLCHQAFQVSSADFDKALESFMERGIKIDGDVEWRKTGTFNGRSLYFFDPTGNRLEINDPNPPYWPENMRD